MNRLKSCGVHLWSSESIIMQYVVRVCLSSYTDSENNQEPSTRTRSHHFHQITEGLPRFYQRNRCIDPSETATPCRHRPPRLALHPIRIVHAARQKAVDRNQQILEYEDRVRDLEREVDNLQRDYRDKKLRRMSFWPMNMRMKRQGKCSACMMSARKSAGR